MDIKFTQLQNNSANSRIVGAKTLSLTGQGKSAVLRNAKGQLIAGKSLAISHGTSPSQLKIANKGGVIHSQDISIVSTLLSGDGDIKASGDLVLDLQDDFNAEQSLSAGGDLSLVSQGDVHNMAQLGGGRRVYVKGVKVFNTATGKIISQQQTQVKAKDLLNEGLVNSNGLSFLDISKTLTNQGSGRIYGNDIALSANKLLNREKDYGQKSGTKSAVIAARQRLDIGVRRVINQEQSEILSIGSLWLGGALDSHHQAVGQAKVLKNNSALLESEGEMSLSVKDGSNNNLHIKTVRVLVSDKRKLKYSLDGHKLWDADNPQVWVIDSKEKPLHTPTHASTEDYYIYNYNERVTRPHVTASAPGKILVGGNLALNIGQFKNNQSTM
ncbi:MAG: hypothetical protein ACWIPH_10530, partial [Ostreibacterium sp.]